MAAVEKKHTLVVKLLLSKGANVHLKEKRGETALMLAEKKDEIDIITLLKQAGAKD